MGFYWSGNDDATKREAVEWLDEFISYARMTAFYRFLKIMRDRAYAYGDQWCNSNFKVLANVNMTQLKTVWNPSSPHIRVTDNRIREFVQKYKSQLSPPFLDALAIPAGFQEDDEHIARVMNALVEGITTEPKYRALQAVRQASEKRIVDGDGIVQAEIWNSGKQKRKLAIGIETEFDDRRLSFRCPDAWEIMLDPFETSPELQDHNMLLHTTVMVAEEAKRIYGADIGSLEPAGTAGSLLNSAHMARAATCNSLGDQPRATSKSKAYILHVLYRKDPAGNWNDRYVFLEGAQKGGGISTKRATRMQVVSGLTEDRPNPFNGLPYAKLGFWHKIGTPWCDGVPALAIHSQNIHNLMLTKVFRAAYLGAPKWIINPSGISPNKRDEVLRNLQSNVDLRVIEYEGSGPDDPGPRLLAAPEPGTAMVQLANMMPNTMRQAVGLEDIQSGRVSKRGESAAAIETRLRAAGSILTEINGNDEETMAEFLGMVCWSMGRHWLQFGINEATNGQAGPESINAYMQQSARNPYRFSVRVIMQRGSMRTKTAEEVRRELESKLQDGQLTREQFFFTMWRRTGQSPDSTTSEAFAAARMESLQLLGGKILPEETFLVYHEHALHVIAHKYALERATSTRRYDPENVARLEDHIQLHEETRSQLALMEGLGGQAAAPGSNPALSVGGTTGGLPAQAPVAGIAS